MTDFNIKFNKDSSYTDSDTGLYKKNVYDVLNALQLDNPPSVANDDHSSLINDPATWSKSNRIGASRIQVTRKGQTESFYNKQKKLLEDEIKKTKRLDLKRHRQLKNALHDLELIQEKENEKLIFCLKNDTANYLLMYLEKNKIQDEKDIRNRLKRIKDFSANELVTTSDCLRLTKEVTLLHNDLLKISSKYALPELSEFNHFSRQLSVITKLWADPYYEKPKTLLFSEKARKFLKLITVSLALLLAIGALICFFIFPPAAMMLALASLIGIWPILDTIIEVGRNAWYRRSPTKEKVIELAVSGFIIAFVAIGAHALSPIGSAIMNTAPQLGKALATAGTFISYTIMKYFNVCINLFGTIINLFGFRKETEKNPISHASESAKQIKSTAHILKKTGTTNQEPVLSQKETADPATQIDTPVVFSDNNSSLSSTTESITPKPF